MVITTLMKPGKDTANMQRWKIAPDWDVKLTDDLRFNGWLSMYKFANDLNTTGYADTRVETETGLQYTFNETVALRVNYYLERGFNMDDSRNNGEFSTQEISRLFAADARQPLGDAVYAHWAGSLE
ncbi:outer membrane protein G [Escherichia coli]|nr:outer membrane protein G [Escherichia coli]